MYIEGKLIDSIINRYEMFAYASGLGGSHTYIIEEENMSWCQ